MSMDNGGKPDRHVSNTGAIQEILGGIDVSSRAFVWVLKEAPFLADASAMFYLMLLKQ